MKKVIVIAEEGERKLITGLNDLLNCGDELRKAEVIVTGVGAINIIRSLGGLDRGTQVINIGYAGSANFEVGTWVEVTEASLNHPNVKYPEPELHLGASGWKNKQTDQSLLQAPCYTNTDFVLQSDYHDCVFDMELAFIAALGFKKVTSFKYVSDNLSLHTYHERTNGVD